MSCLSDHSRCGVPSAPRKYLEATICVAFMLQVDGNSTPRCSKLTEPSRQLVMTTSRRSQVTSSYGCLPAVVHTRRIRRPPPARAGVAPPAAGLDPPVATGPPATPFSGVVRSSRSEEHTSELQSRENLVCRLLLEK